MIYGKVNYRRPTPEEIELLREPIVTKISFSSKSGNRMSNVLLVVAIIATVFFGLDISIVGGIIIAAAWLSYTSVARYKLKEDECLMKAKSDDWWVSTGRIVGVGGCEYPSCMNVFLTSPDITGEFSARVYQDGLSIGDEVYIVCVECSGSNRLMAFTKEMLKPDVYSWFKY